MKGTTTGVWMNGMMKGVVLDDMKTTNGCVAQPHTHFHLKSSERVTADRDTRSTGNTFVVKFDREGVGDGSSYNWISGVEACQFQGYDEKCRTRSLNGRLADAHQVLGGNASAFAATQAASDVHKVRCNAAETVQRTTRFSCGIRWWLHDSDSH